MSETTVWPSPARAWWLITLLFLAGIVSIIDRSVLNIVVDPVRHDLGIGDEQIGLLQGLAFGLFYAFMGIPMGLLADRISRRNLIAGGIALWSCATMVSGLAQSFGQLFAARLLVGLGEAALAPAAISLIADLFAPEKRGRPLSVYMMGQGLANGIAITLTALILASAAGGALGALPALDGLAPWRKVFVLFGASGLIVAALFLTAKEPVRQGGEGAKAALPGAAELRFLIDNRGVLLPLYFGFALCFTVAYGAAAWTPAMLMRGFGASPAYLGKWLGPMAMAFSALGPLIGGFLLDRSMRSGNIMARFRLLMIAPAFAIPAAVAVLAGSLPLAALLVASANAVFSVIGITLFATLQSIVPPRMRGSAISLTLVLNTLIGATLGPLAIASLTTRVLGDPAKVGWSIALVAVPCLCAGMALFALARRNMVLAAAAGTQTARLLAGEPA